MSLTIVYHKDGSHPPSEPGVEWVFVFGSNLSGIHGGGAARAAYEHYGAVWGEGVGYYGHSYAIPTKDENINTLPLGRIRDFVEVAVIDFDNIATDNGHSGTPTKFFVTRVGCGLAGYNDADIAPMFAEALKRRALHSHPMTVSFAEEWRPYIAARPYIAPVLGGAGNLTP
jgi:hypothetical protein